MVVMTKDRYKAIGIFSFKKKPGMVVHACNPITGAAEAEDGGQPRQQNVLP